MSLTELYRIRSKTVSWDIIYILHGETPYGGDIIQTGVSTPGKRIPTPPNPVGVKEKKNKINYGKFVSKNRYSSDISHQKHRYKDVRK